jgi:hypothetical protein
LKVVVFLHKSEHIDENDVSNVEKVAILPREIHVKQNSRNHCKHKSCIQRVKEILYGSIFNHLLQCLHMKFKVDGLAGANFYVIPFSAVGNREYVAINGDRPGVKNSLPTRFIFFYTPVVEG